MTINIDKDKSTHELSYWKSRKNSEGVLGNKHYQYFFTTHFNLDPSFYVNKIVLDIGCGPRGSLEWADMTARRIGVDPLAELYKELGTDTHKMEYIASNSESIPLPNDYCDILTSFNSLDHVDDLDKTIFEIKRLLKPGGTFILITEVNHKPTPCEPISFSWDVIEKFTDQLSLVNESHYEKSADGVYDSIKNNVMYDHSNKADRYGILSAKFVKKGTGGSAATVRASVIICTYNRDDLLGDSIRAVRFQDFPHELYEIVVVDNNSKDNTRKIVEEMAVASPVKIKYVFEGNQGLSFARNAGINNAEGDVIIFTDDDIDAEKNWLRELVAVFEDAGVACAGGPIRPVWPFPRPDWLSDRWQGHFTISEFNKARETGEFKGPDYPWGANIAFRKDIFQTIGMFPTDLGRVGKCLLSNEEINLCRKVEASGKRIAFAPNAVIHHKIDPERIRKLWLYHRTYWQGRSNAVLDLNSGKNIYRQVRNNVAKLHYFASDKNSSDFDRKCVSREIFGYAHQLIKGTPEKDRVGSIRRIRTLKHLLSMLGEMQSVVWKQNMQADKDTEVIQSLRENLRQKDEQIDALLNSLSWKVTKPLRTICGYLKSFIS